MYVYPVFHRLYVLAFILSNSCARVEQTNWLLESDAFCLRNVPDGIMLLNGRGLCTLSLMQTHAMRLICLRDVLRKLG